MKHCAAPAVPQRLTRGVAAALTLATLLLPGCATRAPRVAADAPGGAQAGAVVQPPIALSDARARQLIAQWQRQLGQYLQHAGGGDPTVLAQLPLQRATGTLRPARITFGALDLEAGAAERDGFDVQALLLEAAPGAAAQPYVFVVGTVQRDRYRPLALVDIRLVALTARQGQLDWTVGAADAQALARYRAHGDADAPLRFPADQDRFALIACGARWCADESTSGAHWRLDAGTPAPADAQ